MTYSSQERLERPTGSIDSRLLFVVVTLVMVGLIVVYAATYHRGISFLKWQAVRAAIGLLALFLGAQLRHTVLNRKVRWFLLGGTLLLLLVTLLAGVARGAARRWIGAGLVSIQPAEIAKFALVLWLAGYYARLNEQGRDRSFVHSLVRPGIAVAAVVGLTLAQPAVGTSFIMAASSLALFFIAGVRMKFLVPILLAAAAVFVLAITFIKYPRDRWERFIHGDTYHQEQSLIAIGSGGPVGKGLGEGKQKFFFLPKMHNDFIFAEIGEEFGFAGSLAIYVLYGALFLLGMRVSRDASSPFSQYLAAGITIVLFAYALVHVAVTLGVIPTTGQPLPFVSFGGSALVTNLFAAGVLLNISRYRRNRAVVSDNGHNWSRRPVSGFALQPRNGVARPRIGDGR